MNDHYLTIITLRMVTVQNSAMIHQRMVTVHHQVQPLLFVRHLMECAMVYKLVAPWAPRAINIHPVPRISPGITNVGEMDGWTAASVTQDIHAYVKVNGTRTVSLRHRLALNLT